jgi:3-deoxy-D-manno-octulosonic-acid transferase
MRFLLDAIFYIAFALAWPAWRKKKRGGWAERWGRGEALPAAPGGGRLLVHAVSVGELNAATPIVRRVLADARFASWDVALSATTDTGLGRASSLFGDAERVHVVRYPLDTSRAVGRFFDRVGPSCVALMELELWPNFRIEASRRGVPVMVVNGRLSERSFGRYRAARAIVGWLFRGLAGVGAQDEAYAARFREMGASGAVAMGSTKWDGAADALRGEVGALRGASESLAEELGVDPNKPIVVAGSTAPGEPELIVEAMRSAGLLDEGAQLVCAPRRPEWFDDAAAALTIGGVAPVRRSSGVGTAEGRTGAGQADGARMFVLDTIGELRAAYAFADVVIVGRSFGDLHGSDAMEPAALGKPILMGPRYGDFEQSVSALRDAGGLRVVTRDELAGELGALLRDETARRAMGEASAACVEAQRGAADRYVDMIARVAGLGAGESASEAAPAVAANDGEAA